MRINKLCIALGLVIAFGLFFELAAHADETNESIKFTFSAPVQIPGQVLPAGTYLFERADLADLNVIQIFNADRTVLYATLQTIPTDRAEPTGDTAITLAEPQTGNPVLVKWFYPGRETGHEFVYSKQEEQQIAQSKHDDFVGNHVMPSTEAAGD